MAFVPLEALRTPPKGSRAAGSQSGEAGGVLCYGVLSLERPVMGWRRACKVTEEGVGGRGRGRCTAMQAQQRRQPALRVRSGAGPQRQGALALGTRPGPAPAVERPWGRAVTWGTGRASAVSHPDGTPSPLPAGHPYLPVGSPLTLLGRTFVGSQRGAVVGAGVERARDRPQLVQSQGTGRHPCKRLQRDMAI